MAQVERIQKEVYTYVHSNTTSSSVVHVVYCVQIAESTPLVGEREDLSSLVKEYAEDDEIYQGKIQVSLRSQ